MRTFRLVATPVILLGLLGILLWAASWGWKSLTAPLPTPPPTPCVTREASTVTPASVTVQVYNGGFTSGLANKVGDRLKKAGFVIAKKSNTDERVTKTIIRGNARDEAQLQLVASYIDSATIQHDDRVDGTVDVLVGTQFTTFAPSPKTQVPANGGNICVPASPKPSASPT